MTATADFDPEFAELIDTIGPRRAQALADAGDAVAADIRADADMLDTAPVDGQQLRVLHTLPPTTFGQSRFWRYQLAECATRLAEDARRWGAPVPRCTGEEMVLHLILHRAAAADTGLPLPDALEWPDDPDDPDTWGDLTEYLFQDEDVLTLYDMPAEAIADIVGGVNLTPTEWFTEFTTPFPVPGRP
ncbi:hypothetical protein [Williamsia sp.]|uniref:hypothetical protein n=1 Tax=Williamsia sp. TaxID=1872085 RepID=UPI002F93700A